jgi:cytochrome c oxidase subunit 2
MAVGGMSKEALARTLIILSGFGLGLMALALRIWGPSGVVEVHAAMPDKGGWSRDHIEARVGEPLVLSLVSDDVVHGFAIGRSDIAPVDILPGKPTEITLTFDEAGRYTFYCTRWCGADHWRMRGTITVTGGQPASAAAPAPPLYLQLGIDVDAPHGNHDLDLNFQPSALRGSILGVTPGGEFLTQEYYRSHSPHQAWEDLRASPDTAGLNDADVWDLVAWVWGQATSPAALMAGEALYQRDCAACHSLEGDGRGIFGSEERSADGEAHENESGGHSGETATDFQNQAHMLTASPALLQGKILRGGMGTGMPSWGLIYTDEQTWNLVDYLWSFQFQYSQDR